MSNTKNRVIKVFISSTFRDMNDERDYLNKFVFPRIYEYCNARKIEFYPIDLRWGIQEKDSKNGLVMSTCLEQIDESRPFFIGILGSRYGWIPTQQEVDKMRASVEKQRAWVVGKVNERASITEIEMEYGVLRNHTAAQACFLMRDDSVKVPDDFKEIPGSLEEVKLKALKDKIKTQDRYPVYSYDSLDRFGEIVYDCLMKMIEQEFPLNSKDKEEALISKHEYVLSRRAETLCKLPTITANLQQWLDSKKQFLLVKGQAGYGTSTALCMMVSHLRKKYLSKIIYYDFEEENMNGKVVDKFLQFMKRKSNEVNPEEWTLIALDNCSTLTQSDVNQLIAWMSELSVNTHVIVAAATNSPAEIILSYYFQLPVITIHGLRDDSIKEFIRNYLRQYGKEISDKQISDIMKVEKSEDPTYLTFILNDLVNFGSFEDLGGHLNELIKRAAIYDSYTIESGASSVSKDLDKVGCYEEFSKAMVLLAQMSQTGIPEKDICAIADIPSAKWAIIRPYVMKWCKGNKSKLVLIKPSWDHGIKMIWGTPWQAKIGVHAIEWYLANRKTVTAANAAISIWSYIWHLPIDEAIGEEGYLKLKKRMFGLACSPDVVLALDQQHLTWFMKYQLLGNDIAAPTCCFGRSLQDISSKEQVEYYSRMAQVMKNINSGADEAFCYRQIAETLRKKGQDRKAVCYDALGYLAVGKAAKAIDLVKPLIINEKPAFSLFRPKKTYTVEDKILSMLAQGISCKASILSGGSKMAFSKTKEIMGMADRVLDLTDDIADSSILARIAFEAVIDYYAFACYTNYHDAAFEIYHGLNDVKSLFWDHMTPDYCAQYIHCTSLVYIFCSQRTKDNKEYYEAAYKHSVDAERLAWLSGKEYMQNQAAIVGDYIFFKVRGSYRPSNTQIYGNAYNPPTNYTRTLRHNPRVEFDWNTVDLAVRKQILAERDFYNKMIYEMQPPFKRKEMDTAPDKLKNELMGESK